MKKKLIYAMIAAMVLSFTACTSADSDKDEESSSKVTLAVVKDDSSSDSSEESSNVSEESSEVEKTKTDSSEPEEDSSEEEKKETETDTKSSASIDEQEIWDKDGVKVTATGLEYDDIWGYALKVTVENSSKKDVTVTPNALIVNGFMITDISAVEVSAGNKANGEITLSTSELEKAGITRIGTIELDLHMFDDEFNDLGESGLITLKTSDADKADGKSDITGTTLLDEKGIKVIAQYVEDDEIWGKSIVIYTENNTDKIISVNCDKVAVNGVMIDSIFYSEVYGNRKSIDDITLLSSSLEDNGIDKIDTIELSVSVTDNDYNTIVEGKKITLTT